MLTSAAPLPLGNSDPVQPGPKSAVMRTDGASGGAPETKSKAVPISALDETSRAYRLRDSETAETTDRAGKRDLPALDSPTGPPPAFRETPLERAGRLILGADRPPAPELQAQNETSIARSDQPEPVPSPTQRAEIDFALQQGLQTGPTKPSLEVTI